MSSVLTDKSYDSHDNVIDDTTAYGRKCYLWRILEYFMAEDDCETFILTDSTGFSNFLSILYVDIMNIVY